jgi:2-methylisocitrate lyase-like PEP mutase family enzyme
MNLKPEQAQQASTFTALHVKGQPLIIYNVWDAGTAKLIVEAGAPAIATGSWAVAAAHGYQDGENIPLELVLANLERIVFSVNVPVSLDFESGYGRTPEAVKTSVANVITAGAIGINFEDQDIEANELYSVADQSARIAAVREAADEAGIPFFINARTDIFLNNASDTHSDAHLEEAIVRASAYANAGASGFFAPGLVDPEKIKTLCEQVSLPVNILVWPGTPTPKEMASFGVARISYGAGSYRIAMKAFVDAGRAALAMEG